MLSLSHAVTEREGQGYSWTVWQHYLATVFAIDRRTYGSRSPAGQQPLVYQTYPSAGLHSHQQSSLQRNKTYLLVKNQDKHRRTSVNNSYLLDNYEKLNILEVAALQARDYVYKLYIICYDVWAIN